jgi:FkbM family methyltransferase
MSLLLFIQKFGAFRGFVTWVRVAIGHRGRVGSEYAIALPGYRNTIFLRARTSDHMAFTDLILNGDPIFDETVSEGAVIDAGSNIGLFALEMAHRSPKLRIVCIELDPENFAQLKKNTRGYENIVTINAGLWCEVANLKVADQSSLHWSRVAEQVDNPTDSSVPSITVDEIIKKFGLNNIRLMKIDIEGGEVDLFGKNTEWIDYVDEMYIELHDRFRDGCEKSVLNAVRDKNYLRSTVGEYTRLKFNVGQSSA